MPQIIERKRQDGSIAYVAQINIRRNGKWAPQRIPWAHSESRTFDKHSSAAAWFKKRMKEITAAGTDLSAVKSKGRTLSTAIDRYIIESVKEIGRTKAQVLRSIREYDIASMNCN